MKFECLKNGFTIRAQIKRTSELHELQCDRQYRTQNTSYKFTSLQTIFSGHFFALIVLADVTKNTFNSILILFHLCSRTIYILFGRTCENVPFNLLIIGVAVVVLVIIGWSLRKLFFCQVAFHIHTYICIHTFYS